MKAGLWLALLLGMATAAFADTPEVQTATSSMKVVTKNTAMLFRPRASLYDTVTVQGFYEQKFSQRNFNPRTTTGDLWQTIQNDPAYKRLPSDITLGPLRQETAYHFLIQGRVDEHVGVSWDVEQQPDFPLKSNITITYDESSLSFGQVDVTFNNGEFFQVNRALDGVRGILKVPQHEFKVAQGRDRSTPKQIQFYGNGGRLYTLPNQYILSGSVRVFLNNVEQTEGLNYTLNYQEGTLLFTNPQTSDVPIRVIYEFTDPIADFLPVLARKQFLGAQYEWAPQKIKQVLATQSVQVTLWPVTADQIAEFSPTTFLVAGAPFVSGSDRVQINGKVMTPWLDYEFAPLTGQLRLRRTGLAPDETLGVSATSYVTQNVTQSLVGADSAGPYQLMATPLEGSLQVFINREWTPPDAYRVDPIAKQLVFSVPIAHPAEIDLQYVGYMTDTVTTSLAESPVHVAVTYLGEFTNSPVEALIKEVNGEQQVVTADNSIRLNFNPLTSANAAVVFDANGLIVPSSDYTIASGDAYQGRIAFVSNRVSQTVSVNYTYSLSFPSQVSFSGIDLYEDTAYTAGTEFNLISTPIQYNGIQHVTLFGGPAYPVETEVQIGRDVLIDYGTDGNTVSLRFVRQGDIGGGASQLPAYPDASTSIRLRYLYTPSRSPDEGLVNQNVLGFTVSNQLNDDWSVQSEAAIANHNFSKVRRHSSNIFSGTGDASSRYTLTVGGQNVTVAENSETVFFNGSVLSKDRDYFINYSQGTLRFINRTPSPQDQIVVEYDYFLDNGGTVAGNTVTGVAYKVSTNYQKDQLSLYGDVKKIDFNFLPIGNIAEQKGTFSWGGVAGWAFTGENQVAASYRRREIQKSVSDTPVPVSLDQDDIGLHATWSILERVDTAQEVHFLKQIQPNINPTASQGTYETDSLQVSYAGQAAFGADDLRTTLTGKWADTRSDYLDQLAPGIETSTVLGIRTDYRPLQFWGVKRLTFSPFYNQSRTNSQVVGQQLAFRNVNEVGFNTFVNFTDALRTQLAVDVQYVSALPTTAVGVTATVNNEMLQNISNQLDYDPTKWFSTRWNYQIQQSDSYLVDQTGKRQTDSTFQVRRFLVADGMVASGLPFLITLSGPFKGANAGYTNAFTQISENNGAKQFLRQQNSYSITSWTPISNIRIKSAAYETEFANGFNVAPQTASSSNYNEKRGNKASWQLGIQPPVLTWLSYAWDYTNRTREEVATTNAFSTTNIVTKSTPMLKSIHQFDLNPGTLPFFGPFRGVITLDDQRNVNQTTQIASSNTSASVVTDVRRDNDRVYVKTFKAFATPFTPISLEGLYRNTNAFYDKSQISPETNGSLFFAKNENRVDMTWALLPNLQLKAFGGYNHLNQYFSSTNVAESDVSTLFTQHLAISDYKYGAQPTWQMWSWLALTAGTERNTIFQTVIPALGDPGRIDDNEYNAGVIFSFWAGFTLSYDFVWKTLQADLGAYRRGYASVVKMGYTPIKNSQYTVDISYAQTDSWGEGLNVLQQDQLQLAANRTLPFLIVARNDTVQEGSISVNAHYPLTDFQYADELILSGEGVIKVVRDRIPGNNNSYDISGVLVKAQVLF
jgi:hypothetical protein